MRLKTLSLLTGGLFVLSLLVFVNETKRGTDLLQGSDYIKGLDVGKIQKMVLHVKEDQQDKTIVLLREGRMFVLENHKSYPAASDKVNDLIYKIASIEVKEKVAEGVSEEDLSKYELDEKSRKYLIEIFDNDGNKTVAFRVGKEHKGKGNFLYREGRGEVYLSRSRVWVNSSYKDFINTMLVDIKQEEIEQIRLKGKREIILAKRDEGFVVEGPRSKQFKQEKVKEYAKGLSSLRFEDFYPHSEASVRSLSFDREVKVQLKNKLVYKMNLAKKDQDYFVKLNALVNEIPKQVVVRKEDGKERMQDIERMIEAQGDARRINRERGSWVYRVDKSTYEKLVKEPKFFL